MMTIAQAAEMLYLSKQRVHGLCQAGKFPGAKLISAGPISAWEIPAESVYQEIAKRHAQKAQRAIKNRKPRRTRRGKKVE